MCRTSQKPPQPEKPTPVLLLESVCQNNTFINSPQQQASMGQQQSLGNPDPPTVRSPLWTVTNYDSKNYLDW